MLRRSLPRFTPSLAAVCLAAALVACGGDDDDTSADEPAAAAAAEAAEPADTESGDDGGDSGGATEEPGGEPPTVTELQALAAGATPAGFTAEEPMVNETAGVVTTMYLRDGVMASVMLQPCDMFACWDLDGEITPDHEQNLRSMLSSDALNDPNLVFEYGNVEPAPGYEAFFTYAFQFARDGGSASGTNAYNLTYHDGRTWMMIGVQPEWGPLPETAEDFQAQLDQATGAAIAAEVFAAFADGFSAVS